MAKRNENINCNGEGNEREGKAFRYGEVGRGGMGKTGEGEGEEREGRKLRKVRRAEKEGERETRK